MPHIKWKSWERILKAKIEGFVPFHRMWIYQISAPTPCWGQPSSSVRSRDVLRTDALIVALSRGRIDRRLMTCRWNTAKLHAHVIPSSGNYWRSNADKWKACLSAVCGLSHSQIFLFQTTVSITNIVLLQKTILDTSTLMPSLASSSAACKDSAII
jgi:hypothetical protein